MSTKFTQRILISVFLLAIAGTLPASANSCTNPCTGTAASGSDSTDRTNFNSDNSDLIFSNITFDNATGTPYTAGGLNAVTETSAALYGASFVGCFSSESPCASNSAGLKIATIGNWGGASNPALQINNGNFGSGNFDTFTITLPPNTFAFGVDLLDQNNGASGAPLTVHVTSDMSALAPVVLPGSVFFGYRSTSTPISTVSIWPGYSGVQLGMDNFEVGDPAPTPEAATFFLVGTGLFTLGYARRRKRLQLQAA
jgi:hypothetical protein